MPCGPSGRIVIELTEQVVKWNRIRRFREKGWGGFFFSNVKKMMGYKAKSVGAHGFTDPFGVWWNTWNKGGC